MTAENQIWLYKMVGIAGDVLMVVVLIMFALVILLLFKYGRKDQEVSFGSVIKDLLTGMVITAIFLWLGSYDLLTDTLALPIFGLGTLLGCVWAWILKMTAEPSGAVSHGRKAYTLFFAFTVFISEIVFAYLSDSIPQAMVTFLFGFGLLLGMSVMTMIRLVFLPAKK